LLVVSSTLVVLLILAGALVLVAHRLQLVRTSPPANPGAAAASATGLLSATDHALAATSDVRVGLDGFSGVSTPATAGAATDAYAQSLRLYGMVLATTPAPAASRDAVRALQSELRSDVSYLAGVNGLPPVRLGAYLQGVLTRATQLEATMGSFERTLRSSSQR
jgi:hypothetical protein